MIHHDDLLAEADTLAASTLSITFTGPSSVEARDYVIALEQCRDDLAAALRDEIANGDRLAEERDGWQEEARRLVGVLEAVRSAVLAPYLDPNTIARSIDLSLSGSVSDANTLALAAHRALRGIPDGAPAITEVRDLLERELWS